MRIDRVRLSGFKSFVDPVEVRVLPGLTGIVGPNGCGKSNLLEAIRWAMGEGSAKSLRGAGMDDVIFAGTDTRPQRQFAEVAITVDRDGEEVDVIRRIERGAGSAWRISGRDARARDAQLLFADAATGAHSPALVSQGRIGAVIAAKPAERRAMLEEAAGIAGLHVRRREAEIRLKATETNLSRVEELVAEMEARANVLRRQARAAERYRKLSDAIRIAEGRVILARWREAAAAADSSHADAKAAEAKVAQSAEAQRLTAIVARDAGQARDDARVAALAAREAASEARHALTSGEADLRAIEQRIATLAADRARLIDDRDREGELSRDAGEALARLADETAALARRIKEHEASRGARVEQVAAAETAAREAELVHARATAEAAQRDAERRVAEAALAAARSHADRADRDHARAAAEVNALKPLVDVEAAGRAAAETLDKAMSDADASVATIATAEAGREVAADELAEAQRTQADAGAALAALESERRALASAPAAGGALATVQAAPGYEAALAAVLADDLSADVGSASEAPRRWTGAETLKGDPELSAGPALAAHVTAPLELARRLAQIAVVDRDDGAALAVGQRLVTRDGKVRRWDGFRSNGAGAAEAERLVRRNRLVEVDALLVPARQTAENEAARLAVARTGVDRATRALSDARAARDTAESTLRTALRAVDVAAAELARVREGHERASARLADVTRERDAALAEVAAAQNAIALLPAPENGAVLAALASASQVSRDRVVSARSDLMAFDAALDSDRARVAAAKHEGESWRSRSGKAAKRVEDMARRMEALDAEAETLADAPERAGAAVGALTDAAGRTSAAADVALGAERDADARARSCEGEAARAAEGFAVAREQRAAAAARAESQEARRSEMARVSGERFECPPPVLPQKLGFDSGDLGAAQVESNRFDALTVDRERLGPVNLVAETELAEIEAARETSAAEMAELIEATHRLRGAIGSLNREGRMRLRAAFEAVDEHFRRLFSTLFNGGEAHLEMIDSDDPLEAGLEIMAQPPGKKLTSLTLLSGGEQALTAVALIFALFLTNPAPLCVLDEVDAPLDDANVERFCDLLDAMTVETDTRFLIVTHNAVTMSRLHRLYGVTMVERGISRLVAVDLGGAQELLAAE